MREGDGVNIDHASNVPVYVQVANEIRRWIDAGEIPPHRAIPSKRMLVQEFGVAPNTVDKAVILLKAEGRLETVAGKGLFVTDPSEWRSR